MRCVSSPREQGALRSCLTISLQKLDCRMCLSALRKLPRTAEWCGLSAAVLFCPNQQLNKCLSFFPNNFCRLATLCLMKRDQKLSRT